MTMIVFKELYEYSFDTEYGMIALLQGLHTGNMEQVMGLCHFMSTLPTQQPICQQAHIHIGGQVFSSQACAHSG